MPNTNALTNELTAVAGFDGNGNMCVTTSTAISMTPSAGAIGTVSITLTRKPATSAAAVASSSFTADVAGLYIVTVAQGSTTATYRVLALPAAAFTVQRVNAAYVGSRFVNAGDVLQIMPQVTAASAAASVELAAAGSLYGLDQRLVGGTSTNGFNWRQYANDI